MGNDLRTVKLQCKLRPNAFNLSTVTGLQIFLQTKAYWSNNILKHDRSAWSGFEQGLYFRYRRRSSSPTVCLFTGFVLNINNLAFYNKQALRRLLHSICVTQKLEYSESSRSLSKYIICRYSISYLYKQLVLEHRFREITFHPSGNYVALRKSIVNHISVIGIAPTTYQG